MWHQVVIEIERRACFLKGTSLRFFSDDDKKRTDVEFFLEACWNILYKAPIEDRKVGDDELESTVFHACQVWIEQNKVEGSKYTIMKMFIV